MPHQTIKTDFSYPDGLRFEISVNAGGDWSDVGVLAAGAGFTFNFDKVEIEPGNAAKPEARAKNMTVALAPSALWSQDTDVLQKMSGGLFTRTTVAGTLVEDHVQTFAANSFALDTLIELEGQNATGAMPTVSLVRHPDGTPLTLVLGTDYEMVRGPNGNWGVLIMTSGSGVTTRPLEVTSDYTPAASTSLHAGSTSKTITRFQARFRHMTDLDLGTYDFEFVVYAAEMNAGIQIAKKGANEEGLDEVTVSLTGQIDTSRDDNKQLFSMLLAA